jgi:hypothetical protein
MYTEILLDKPRRLRFDLDALKDLEAAMGAMPLGTIHSQLGKLGLTAVCLALWAGLKHEDATLTPKLTTKILQSYLQGGGSISTVIETVSTAIDECGLFHAEGAEGNAPPEPLPPTT